MKILMVTEKCSPSLSERDGGARLVETLKEAFGNSMEIMQFGHMTGSDAKWHFAYPVELPNRFEKRVANGHFIAEKIRAIENLFTHIIFIHVSMQFGIVTLPLRKEMIIWTFPMFLTPSYIASGERVPKIYQGMERVTLAISTNILTPSPIERRQLIDDYSIPDERIHMVPRGIDMRFIIPKVRSINGPPKFCSIGSIKPQKNTIGLIQLFMRVRNTFPGATLKIIGPIQNLDYFNKVRDEIQRLGLYDVIEFSGYTCPEKLPLEIEDTHFHLSMSTCETFGRSIFETLASGLPNIIRKYGNAAADFLEHLPYARFTNNDDEVLDAIKEMIVKFSKISSMALEIGRLYADKLLSRLIAAKVFNKETVVVSDFDGTLFHKHDSEKTSRCIQAFKQFSKKIICSARATEDLICVIKSYNLEVDWIIGYSGAMVTNGKGDLLWRFPLSLKDVTLLEKLVPQAKRIEHEGEVLQMAIPMGMAPDILGLRRERYQETEFVVRWESSKFKAIHQLLSHINWSGQVYAFGDGAYDAEFLTYFDGTIISPISGNVRNKQEVSNGSFLL